MSQMLILRWRPMYTIVKFEFYATFFSASQLTQVIRELTRDIIHETVQVD
jgi:hypothetical protein